MSVTMSGTLGKCGEKGLVKRWKNRWFEVIGYNVNYSKGKGEAMIGSIDLTTASCVLPSVGQKTKGAFGFEIRTPDRVWYLFSESQIEQEAWIAHIRGLIEQHQAKVTTPRIETTDNHTTAAGVASTSNSTQSPPNSNKTNGTSVPPPVPFKPTPPTPPSPSTSTGPPPMPAVGNKPPVKKAPVPIPPKAGAGKKVGGPPTMPKLNSPPGAKKAGFAAASSPSLATSPSASYSNNTSSSDDHSTSSDSPSTAPGSQGRGRFGFNLAQTVSPPVRPTPPQVPPKNLANSQPALPSSASDSLDPLNPPRPRKASAARATVGDFSGMHIQVSHSVSPVRPGHSTVPPSQLANMEIGNGTSTPPSSSGAPAATNADKRTKVANEILQTEKYYVGCLQCLSQDFMQPLLADLKSEQALEYKVNESDIRSMFSNNLAVLISVNEELLKGLESKMASFDPASTIIGDVFSAIGPFLKMYLDYSKNYQTAIDTYNRLVANEKFAQRLLSCKEKARVKLGLDHLLIMPVQRIPRYLLLLGELKKDTGGDHPDFSHITKAIEKIEAVANHINEQMKRSEVGQKALNYPELVAPHRYLMWEGTIETRVDKEKEEAKIVLFNDMLLHHPAKKIAKGSKWHLQPENSCSIQLVWTAPASVNVTADKSAIGPVETIDLIIPAKRMTLVASSVEERNLLKQLREALSRHFGTERPPVEREAEHTFSDEASYNGSWKEGKMHGNGIMHFKGISTFSGQWEMGVKCGPGSMAWVSGNTYDGQWHNDLPHGEGTFVWPNSDNYSGTFSEGLKNGKGTFTWSNGAKYTGDWVRDKPSGTGVYESATESYSGGWYDGYFHGQGTYKEFHTGRTYEGAWSNGLRDGQGICNYANGSEYAGNWKKNRREGRGVFTLHLGDETDTYNGEWSDDRKNGYGIWSSSDGSMYEGSYKDDQRNGKGKLKFSDNDPAVRMRYEGEFEYDRMCGKGTLWFKNGDSYEGSFKDNVFHGQGTYQYASSIKTEGKYAQGQLEGKGAIHQQINPGDKKLTHIVGTFHHGSFQRAKDSATKFEIPVAPVTSVINIVHL